MVDDAPHVEAPLLNRGVRYHWDNVRQQHQLLYPEGVLILNETGAAIIGLCDGRSAADIKRELSEIFSDAALEEDVDNFLVRLVRKGLVCDNGNT